MAKNENEIIEYLESKAPSSILNDKNPFTAVDLASLNRDSWVFTKAEANSLLQKIRQNKITLADVTQRIFQGVKTSADKVFILRKITELEHTYLMYSAQLGLEVEMEKKIMFPLIKGGNSKAYHISEPELLILFPYRDGHLIPLNTIQIEAPLTMKYLLENKNYLEERESGKMKTDKWYGYIYPKALNVILRPKIFTPDIAPSPRFALDEPGMMMFTGGASGGYGITPNKDVSFNFLLGVLNSKLTEWYIKTTSTQMRGGWYSFESRFIKSIPFPSRFSNAPLEEAVQDQKGENKELNSQIDELVYQLYGLAEEEIKIVEGGER